MPRTRRSLGHREGFSGKEGHLSRSLEEGDRRDDRSDSRDGGIKIGDLKKLDSETLINNYGIKKEVAKSVLDAVKSGPRSSSRQRFLADVLSDDKKKVDKIEETRFKREQKDIHAELQEKKEQLRLARVEGLQKQEASDEPPREDD